MSDLSYQENLVVARLEHTLTALNEANDVLERRATRMVTLSTSVVAATNALGLLPTSITGISRFDAIWLLILALLNLLLIRVGLHVWGPGSAATAGGTNFDDLKKFFIDEGPSVACLHHIKDLISTIDRVASWNHDKGLSVTSMLWILQVQIGVVAMASISKLLC